MVKYGATIKAQSHRKNLVDKVEQLSLQSVNWRNWVRQVLCMSAGYREGIGLMILSTWFSSQCG